MRTNKKCTICLQDKPIKRFGKNKSCKGGISTRCKDCDNDYLRRYYAKNVKKRMLLGARDRAEKQGLKFDLKENDFVIPDTCPALGIPLKISNKRGGTDNSPSLDRVEPRLGYVKENVVVISGKANRIKSNCAPDEIILVGNWLAQKLTEKNNGV